MAELIKDIKELSEGAKVEDNILLKIINIKAKHCLIKNMIDSIYCFA